MGGSMSSGKQGKCFGKLWDANSVMCSRCYELVRAKCEEKFKRKLAMSSAGEDGQTQMVGADGAGIGEFSANEHFLRLLEGKLERLVTWGGKMVESKFSRDGKVVVFAAYRRDDGKMKVGTAGLKKLVMLKDVAQAEELAKEVLAEVKS